MEDIIAPFESNPIKSVIVRSASTAERAISSERNWIKRG
jgi:hypothetical protein